MTCFAALSLGDTAEPSANCAAVGRRQLGIWAKIERDQFSIFLFYMREGQEWEGGVEGDSWIL